jgi:hypothetical protein
MKTWKVSTSTVRVIKMKGSHAGNTKTKVNQKTWKIEANSITKSIEKRWKNNTKRNERIKMKNTPKLSQQG